MCLTLAGNTLAQGNSFKYIRYQSSRPSENKDFVYYRDAKYSFAARYPKGWSSETITDSITRLSVESEDGVDAFSINVVGTLGLRPPTPKEFVAQAQKTDYASLLRPQYPDITLLESGETAIGDQEGFYRVFRATFIRHGISALAIMLQVQTVMGGNIYTLSCATAAERFAQRLPLFRSILSGFVFLREPVTDTSGADSHTGARSVVRTPGGFRFYPQGSDFHVVFPAQPTVSIVDATFGGERARFLSAVLVLEQDQCFLRAEFVPGPSILFEKITNDQIVDALYKYAENNGLEVAETSVANGKIGRYGVLRGYKAVRGIRCIYEAKGYYGRNSMMVLLAGGPAKTFPQPSVTRFFASIGR